MSRTRDSRGGPWDGVLLLLLAVPFLTLPASLVLVVLTAGFWCFVARPPARQAAVLLAAVLWCVVLTLAATPAAFHFGEESAAANSRHQEEHAEQLSVSYSRFVQGFLEQTRELSTRLQRHAKNLGPEDLGDGFVFLEAALGQDLGSPSLELTVTLIDETGSVYAWFGPGLRHRLPNEVISPGQVRAVESFTAATFLAASEIPNLTAPTLAPWTLVTGQSFAKDRLFFEPPAGHGPREFRWALAGPQPLVTHQGTTDRLRIEATDSASIGPALTLDERKHEDARLPPGALVVLGLALLVLVILRAALLRAHERALPFQLLLLGTSLALLGAALGASPTSQLLSVVGAWTLAIKSRLKSPRLRRRTFAILGLLGTLGFIGLLDQVFFPRASLQWIDTPGSLLFGGINGVLGRVGAFLLLVAMVVFPRDWTRNRYREAEPGQFDMAPNDPRWESAVFWTTVGLVMITSAFWLDRGLLGLLPAALAGAAIGWLSTPRRSPGGVGTILVALALLAALGFELCARRVLLQDAKTTVLASLAATEPDELEALIQATQEHFETLDLTEVALGPPERIEDARDLALALWQDSPLVRRDVLSTVAVLGPDGLLSRFGHGLSLDPESLLLDPDSAQSLYPWSLSPAGSTATLTSQGNPGANSCSTGSCDPVGSRRGPEARTTSCPAAISRQSFSVVSHAPTNLSPSCRAAWRRRSMTSNGTVLSPGRTRAQFHRAGRSCQAA